jgi:hypothetical protein
MYLVQDSRNERLWNERPLLAQSGRSQKSPMSPKPGMGVGPVPSHDLRG